MSGKRSPLRLTRVLLASAVGQCFLRVPLALPVNGRRRARKRSLVMEPWQRDPSPHECFLSTSSTQVGCAKGGHPWVIALVLLCTLVSPAFAQDTDAQFLEGLRQRRLYSLAETYCRQQLENPELTPTEEANLTIELARVLAGQALDSPTEGRDAIWQSAHDVLADFVEANPENPRSLLIRVQDALVQLAHGQQTRQEAELTADPESLQTARQLLHVAVVLFDGILDDAEQARRQAARAEQLPSGALTANELAALQKNVGYQLARTLRQESLAYPPESNERTHSLLRALAALEPLVQRQPEDSLYWQCRLEEVACLRLLGRTEETQTAIRQLEGAELSPAWQLQLRAEELLLALKENDLQTVSNFMQQGRGLAGVTLPELDLAFLQGCLAMAEAAREDEDTETADAWQNQAAQLLSAIEQDHGAYHLRRAEAMLATTVGNSQDAASLDLLARTADTYYRRAQFEQAIEAYDSASNRAAEAGDAERAFKYAFTAAAILQERARLEEANVRLLAAARTWPQAPRAAEAHLAAAYNAAQLVRSDPAVLEEYIALLEEHLTGWPDSPTANEAAWLLGRIQQARREWSAARQAYLSVTPELPEYPAALAGAEICWQQEINALAAAGGDAAGQARLAAEYFEGIVLGSGRQLPAEWSPETRVAALAAARMRLTYTADGFEPAEALLNAALAGMPLPEATWEDEAQALLVVALAGLGRRVEADNVVSQIAGGSPERLLETLEALGRLSSGAGAQASEELANLQLRTIALLEQQMQALTEPQRATMVRIKAGALAAAGRRTDALALYRELAAARPDDALVQQSYAELLATGGDAESLRAALDQWRRVAARSPELSDRWWQARYAIAELHAQLGEKDRAAEMIQLLSALHPELGGPAMKAKFEALLAQCQ